MRFDQSADILRAAGHQRFLGRARAAEPPGAVGQRGERAGDPAQHEIEQADEHQEQDQRLENEGADDPAIGGWHCEAGDLPAIGARLPQADDQQFMRRGAQALVPYGVGLLQLADERIRLQRAVGDDDFGHFEALAFKLARDRGLARRIAFFAGEQRAGLALRETNAARQADERFVLDGAGPARWRTRAPAPFVAQVAALADEELEARSAGHGKLAPLGSRAVEHGRRDCLRDQQRSGQRQHDLAEQATGQETRHALSSRATRVTSAPKR